MTKNIKRGINLEDVQELNRALVIRLLRKLKVCSRADLAKSTGLKQSTITNIIGDLISWELVTERGIIDGAKGRRSIGISLNTELFKVISVRLARKYFSVGIFDLCGSGEIAIHEQLEVFEGSTKALQRIRDAVKTIIANNPDFRFLGVGVAIPGPFFRSEGKIALMTEFPGWERISLEEELSSAFHIPVFFEHDANAGVLAEWWLGPHSRETGTIVYVAAGLGIGAGIVIDGRLFRGTLGVAGEIGHMSIDFDGPKCECGNNGCLEHYCSAIALQREVKKELANFPDSPLQRDHSFEAILGAIGAGDDLAVREMHKAAWHLGLGLVNVVNLFNPDVITIGDEMARVGPPLLEIVKEVVQARVLPSIYKSLRIELCSFECDPVLIGVSALVVEKMLLRPSAWESLAPPDADDAGRTKAKG
jgi:N-acetylglucosamine repressor